MGLSAAASIASDQLFIHSSFTKTTNRGHTRAEQGRTLAGNAVATETERHAPPPTHPSYLWLIPSTCSPLSLPCPSSVLLLLLSPAPLEQIGSCLSLARWEQAGQIQGKIQRRATADVGPFSTEEGPTRRLRPSRRLRSAARRCANASSAGTEAPPAF